MIAQTISFLVLVAVATAAVTKNASEEHDEDHFSLENIDPNTLSCDPLGQVFLLLPHFSDCGKFYMCAHGEEVEFTCPATLYFDFILQTCNWPRDTKCWLRDEEGSGVSAGEIGMFGEEIENGPVEILTAEASGTVRPVAPTATRFSNGILNCNKADDAARQVPYKGDCQRYWKCVGGVPQSAYCSDGLFFNESSSQCDHEANVHCNVVVEDELKGEFMVAE